MAEKVNKRTGLTAKQEKFAQAMLTAKTQGSAYRLAYEAAGMSAASVDTEACLLLQNPKVAQRLETLRERLQATNDCTLASIVGELDALKKSAIMFGQFAPALNAILQKAKFLGIQAPPPPPDELKINLGPSWESLVGNKIPDDE